MHKPKSVINIKRKRWLHASSVCVSFRLYLLDIKDSYHHVATIKEKAIKDHPVFAVSRYLAHSLANNTSAVYRHTPSSSTFVSLYEKLYPSSDHFSRISSI